MSEHDARTPSDPTSDAAQPQSTESDVTAQVPVTDPPAATEPVEQWAADTTSPEATEVVAVVETPADTGSAASLDQTNILEVPAPTQAVPTETPAYAASTPPAYAAPAPDATYPPPPAAYGPGASAPAYPTPAAYQAPPTYGPPRPPQPSYGAPVAPLTPENERQIGALAHGVAGAATAFSGGTLGFIAALVIYLIYKDRGPFVRAHAANALNVQIMTGIALIVSGILMFVLIGFITYPIILVVGVVLHIIGALKAWNGEWWTPPLTPQFVK